MFTIEDFAGKLHGKSIFTTLDLVRAYYQIRMTEKDIQKTAVTDPLWPYLVSLHADLKDLWMRC